MVLPLPAIQAKPPAWTWKGVPAQRVLATRWVVYLLRSRRRTFFSKGLFTRTENSAAMRYSMYIRAVEFTSFLKVTYLEMALVTLAVTGFSYQFLVKHQSD